MPISIVGAGAIGSWTTLLLAKMGYQGRLRVYDDDRVAPENIAGQVYSPAMIGEYKAEALEAIIRAHGNALLPFIERCAYAPADAIVLMAVDDMDVRKALWESRSASTRWWIDARMGGETMRVYTVKTASAASRTVYEHSLYSTAESTPLPCTERSIIYNVAIVAGLVVNQVKRLSMGQPYWEEQILELQRCDMLRNGRRTP